MQLKRIHVEPERLVLDPNNYRFHDLEGYKRVIEPSMYADEKVQSHIQHLLESTRKFRLESLKDSILTNGFVRFEHLVVEEFDEAPSGKRYLVVEGNRRVAAVRSLLEEWKLGQVSMGSKVRETLDELPAYEIHGEPGERESIKQTLMAIRHVAGIERWGANQQAKLVALLYEQQDDAKFGPVGQRIGISATEVGRRYRGIKALEQMEDDEEYGEYARPQMYALFHELVSLPDAREWIGWSDTEFRAEDSSRWDFYELIIPHVVNGEEKPATITDVRQVRKLKKIVTRPQPRSILLDPERTFQEALDAAEFEEVEESPGLLEHSLAQAINSLKKPGIDAWLEPSSHALNLWSKLVAMVEGIRSMMKDAG